jgi:hypothetical protein
VTVWTDKLDMSTIPDDVLHAEVGRRRVAHRDPENAGRPRLLRPCKWCKQKFGAREMRVHVPACPKRH